MAFLIIDSIAGAREMIEKDIPMPFHTIAIRIFSSYLQVAGMLMSFRITLPKAVTDLVTLQRSASAVVEQTLSFDCTAGSRRGLELFFMKQTMAVTLPLMLPLVGCIWVLANAWKRMRRKKLIQYLNDKIAASIVVLYYLVFPAIVTRIAITFACTEYGNDGFEENKKYLMQRSLTTQCYSTVHMLHIASVTVPAILLYMLLIPGYLMYELHRLRRKGVLYSHSKNYEPGWTYRYGFLFAGYEPKYAFWEIVVLVRKAAFVLVTVFTRPAGMAAQVMAAVLVLILSLSAHIHFSPYDHDSHDHLESAALHASLISLPVALLANEMSLVYGTGSIGEGGQQILGPAESAVFTMTAFSTFGFFMYLFFHGILMERVDDPGPLGRLSRSLCKCWHKKDKTGQILRVKSTKSKSMRRKTISRMAIAHGDAGRSHLIAMGMDPDEVHREFNRISGANETEKPFSRDETASQVKVLPVLLEKEGKVLSATHAKLVDPVKGKGKGRQKTLVAGTVGSAYLDLLPDGVNRPSGAVENKGASDDPKPSPKGSVALRVEAPLTAPSTPVVDKGAVASKAPEVHPKSLSKSYVPTPSQTVSQRNLTETMTVKELKKAYKQAKAEALKDPENTGLAKKYADYKTRYLRAKEMESRLEGGGAAPSSLAQQPAMAPSTKAGSNAAAADSMARRLSRNRNRMKAAGTGMAAVLKVKRQSQ